MGQLNNQGDCLLPQAIGLGSQYSCTVPVNVNGSPGATVLLSAEVDGADQHGNLVTAEGSTSVKIDSGNDAPEAQDQLVSTDEDMPLDITLTASDPNLDPLTDSVVAGPSHGRSGAQRQI